MSYTGRWIAVSGVRDLAHQSQRTVEVKMREVMLANPAGLVFGGARGVDTLALLTAREFSKLAGPPLVVVVPGYVRDQPPQAQTAIKVCASEIIQLGLPLRLAASYKTRNQRMLREVSLRAPALDAPVPEPLLLAFPPIGGEARGGTCMTIGLAIGLGIAVEEVKVAVVYGGED